MLPYMSYCNIRCAIFPIDKPFGKLQVNKIVFIDLLKCL